MQPHSELMTGIIGSAMSSLKNGEIMQIPLFLLQLEVMSVIRNLPNPLDVVSLQKEPHARRPKLVLSLTYLLQLLVVF